MYSIYLCCYTFYVDEQDECKPVIADGKVPNRRHGILSRWKEEKKDLKDENEDDSSLPDLPACHVPRTVKAQSGPQKRLKRKRSDAKSTDNQLNDSDGSSSSKSSKGSKGKAGGRGGKAKSRPAVDLTLPVEKETLTHGIVKKGALQAAIKFNQQRQKKNVSHTTATEIRPTSTSTPKELSPTERNKPSGLSIKAEHTSTQQQQFPATGAPLDDEIIIDVEVTRDELSQINKVKPSPFSRMPKMSDIIVNKYKQFCLFVSSIHVIHISCHHFSERNRYDTVYRFQTKSCCYLLDH